MPAVCKEFYHGFLDPLNEDARDKVTEAIHGFQSHNLNELNKIFEDIVLDVEDQHGVDSLLGHVIVDHFALLLNKREDKEGAIAFLERKLKRRDKDEFHTLVTLAGVHEKNGQYQDGIRVLERAKNIARDDLEMALIYLKLAADHWNFESKSVQSFAYQEKGTNLLKQVERDGQIVLDSPSNNDGIHYVHAYKTAAYLYRIQDDKVKSGDCYRKAISIIEKSPESKLPYLKTLTQLCSVQADLQRADLHRVNLSTVLLRSSIQKGVSIADQLTEDEFFVNAHPDAIAHIYSRLAHCYQNLNSKEDSLALRLKTLDILKEHLGTEHPETGRMSADVALNYYFVNERAKCDEHIEFAEEVLTLCNYKEDPVKAKLFFREISDTLRLLGNLFSLMSEFGDSERQYLNSLELHEKVYGQTHQRVSRVYRYLGNMYVKWEKKDKAIENLNKAIEVQKLYLPASRELIGKIEKDLERARNPIRKGKSRGNRGRYFH